MTPPSPRAQKIAEEIIDWYDVDGEGAREALVEQVARALDAEREWVADWFQGAFCIQAGVPTMGDGDERHARGDCEPCNIATAIRKLGHEAALADEEGFNDAGR